MDDQTRELDLMVADLEQESRLMRARMDRLEKENATMVDDLAKLRAFAAELLKDWPDYMGLDGFELQDLAIKHGLLVGSTVTQPCRAEGCQCAEYNTDAEMEGGVTCYRKSDVLKVE